MADYLFQGKLDNMVHDISYDQIRKLYEDNLKEAEEGEQITQSSYRGKNFYTPQNRHDEFEKEILYRDPKTAGLKMQYPHGVILEQSLRRNYYRGERQIYTESIPSLLRKLQTYNTIEERELYRLVADMRIYEFACLLNQFQHVQNWKCCDVLYDVLAQHYGLETGWLDITSDFNVALFFATCYYDYSKKRWLPLTKAQTEFSEDKKYGMIYHMPSNRMSHRWSAETMKFADYTDKIVGYDADGNAKHEILEYPRFSGQPANLIYPIGFQPFMRCHMQDGYAIYMRIEQPLQQDYEFEKLRFRHNEKLSEDVYDMMDGGELIYPHEGLKQAEFIIESIAKATEFSEDAFYYALQRSHKYRTADEGKCRDDLKNFLLDGRKIVIAHKHPWKLSSGRRKKIDRIYENFSIEAVYGIRVIDRPVYPGGAAMFAPWMLPDKKASPGVEDFKARQMEGCSNLWTRDMMNLLATVKYAELPDF